jgi:hypothetical protein
VAVTVDGVACAVTAHSLSEIRCTTGAASQASTSGVEQPGQPGITRRFVNTGTTPSFDDVDSFESTDSLFTSMEIPRDHEDTRRTANVLDGWFKAPETGRYRFYLACADECKLSLDSSTAYDVANPASSYNEQQLLHCAHTGWRHYLLDEYNGATSTRISNWVNLSKDEYYKIKAIDLHRAGWSDYYMTVAVEFEKSNTAGMHHSNREVQILMIDQDQIPEIWSIVVTAPDAATTWQMIITNPNADPAKDQKVDYVFEQPLTGDCTADELRHALLTTYYHHVRHTDISVSKTYYDTDGNVTTVADAIATAKYEISLSRRIDGPSFEVA